jgi:drug/metabolite transporter (DMT)-like permease
MYRYNLHDVWEFLSPLLLLVLVQTIFSGYVVLTAASLSSKNTPPLIFALLRDAVASSCFLAALLCSGAPRLPRRDHYGYIIALGGLAVFGTQLLGVLAIRSLSAVIYGFLTPVVPVVTVFISYALGMDTFDPRSSASWRKVGGVIVTVSGAVFIVASAAPAEEGGGGSGIGIAYIIVQKVCEV